MFKTALMELTPLESVLLLKTSASNVQEACTAQITQSTWKNVQKDSTAQVAYGKLVKQLNVPLVTTALLAPKLNWIAPWNLSRRIWKSSLQTLRCWVLLPHKRNVCCYFLCNCSRTLCVSTRLDSGCWLHWTRNWYNLASQVQDWRVRWQPGWLYCLPSRWLLLACSFKCW